MDCTSTPEAADINVVDLSLHAAVVAELMSPQERSGALIDAVVAKTYADLKAGKSALSVHFSALENEAMSPQERSGALIDAVVAAFEDTEAGKFALRAERERNEKLLTRVYGKPAPLHFDRAVADVFGVSAVPDV